MLKLVKYLKPFLFGVLAAVALLFIQAMCDLNLPNYMSKIVNVGLQQGGIETAAPDAVSQAGLEFVSEFMSDEEKALVEQNYTSTYVVNSNSYGKGLEEKYPNQKGNQIYILNENISEETRTELNGAFENSTYTMAGFLKTLRSQSGTQQSSTDMSDMDITELYKMQPMLAESKDLISEARLQALDTDESIKSQSAIMFTRAFYKELGVDLGSIQTGYIINIGLMMLLIAVIGGIATVAVSFISSLIASGVARNLRNDIFKKVASFSNAEYDKFSTSSLITRSTNDVMQIQIGRAHV